MPDPRLIKRHAPRISQAIAMVMACASALAESPRAEFFRGINLNGPPVVIDGHLWEGGDSKNFASRDLAFENQAVQLIPPTDPERARMIRSSRWAELESPVDVDSTGRMPATPAMPCDLRRTGTTGRGSSRLLAPPLWYAPQVRDLCMGAEDRFQRLKNFA
jgi:hypothetical protein